jgi:CRP-like cAMP-binding protein
MGKDLHKIRLFSSLPDDVLYALDSSIQRKKYKKGSMVIWAQDECKAVYFVLSGMIEVFQLALSGREQAIERINPGESFNLVPVFMDNALNQANARALEDSLVLSVDKREFHKLLEQHPHFSKVVAEYFAMRLTYMVSMVESLGLYSVRQRMAAFLIEQADMTDQHEHPRWTQEDMARSLGTVRDVVGRVLRKFEEEKLIRFNRQHITLLNKTALQNIADGGETRQKS